MMVTGHLSFVWRSLRRFGVWEADVDDATQEVFLVISKRLSEIPPEKERAFLYSTAVRVAANIRRSRKRRDAAYERFESAPPTELAATPETVSDQLRARQLLVVLLEYIPEDLREVFVLFEVEELGIGEIADVLQIPLGTVGSRLRRARERFKAALARHQTRQAFQSKAMP
jgi:RNA polymerase sigma-70 factor (ECF subfamily)